MALGCGEADFEAGAPVGGRTLHLASLQGSNKTCFFHFKGKFEDDTVGRLVVVDTDKAIEDIGSPKAMNMVLLGAASRAGLLGDITHEDIIEAMKKKVKPRFVEMNIRALEYADI